MSAYDEGYEAFQDGDEKDDNPYKYGTKDYFLWLRGYKEAEALRGDE